MKSKTIKTLSIISIIGILGYTGFSFIFPNAKEQEISINTSSISLERSNISKTISASGSIASVNVVNLTNTLNSPMKNVNVKVGDLVEKGDVLAQVDTTNLQNDIDQAQKSYNDAKYLYDQKLKNAYDDLDEAKRNYAGGYLEGTAEWKYVYDDAINWDSKVQSAQQAYDNILYNDTTINSKNNLESLIETKSNAKIVAPVSGVITTVNASVGNTTTGIIFVIQDPDSFKVQSSIAAYDINEVYVGQNTLVLATDINLTYKGTITQVSPTANTSGDYNIEVMLEGDLSQLRIGMNSMIEILIDEKENVYVLPLSSIVTEGNESYIIEFNVDTSESIKHIVTIGLQNDYYAEVNGSSLVEGMNILSDPLNKINYTDTSVTPGGPFGGNE